MKKIIILGDKSKKKKKKKKKKLEIWGKKRKKKIRETITELEPLFRRKSHLSIIDISDEEELGKVSADIAFIFGGDGTILSASRKLNGKQIPLIGVHLGKFGFLADLTLRDISNSLEKILAGEYV